MANAVAARDMQVDLLNYLAKPDRERLSPKDWRRMGELLADLQEIVDGPSFEWSNVDYWFGQISAGPWDDREPMMAAPGDIVEDR